MQILPVTDVMHLIMVLTMVQHGILVMDMDTVLITLVGTRTGQIIMVFDRVPAFAGIFLS